MCEQHVPAGRYIIEVDGGRYDGQQLYVDDDTWVCVAQEDEKTNTDPQRREWNYENGIMSLPDGRQHYSSGNYGSKCTAELENTHTNTADMRREWIFENGIFTHADGRQLYFDW